MRTDLLTTVLICLPLLGALAVWLLPARSERIGALAFLIALAEVAVWITAVQRFDFSSAELQFEQKQLWISDLGISYHVGLFGFSLWLVGLSTVVMAAAIGYGLWAGRDRGNGYYALMLLLTGAIVCTFAAQDLILFYVAYEGMLIPLYILIGVWGGAGRLRATFKLVAYTMTGSLLMLVAIIVFGLRSSFDLTASNPSDSIWMFLAFAGAFALKAPLFPFHGWLADAYRESPPEVAGVLSGVVSKVALFGLIRIGLMEFPQAVHDLRPLLLALGAITLVYGSLLAFRAPDIRGVVAYSSLAQMGLISLGIFSANELSLNGAVLLMVTHGLVSTTLFLLAGGIERRTSTGQLDRLGGMARGRPVLATLILSVGLIALAVPGSSAFAAEFLLLAGVFREGWGWALAGLVAVVLAAMYMLRLISAVLHDDVGSSVPEEALDIRPAELGILMPLLLGLLALSVWPAAISQRSFPCISATVPAERQIGAACISSTSTTVNSMNSRYSEAGGGRSLDRSTPGVTP
jgi:NADH-quinone oxidoreductase subunit M